MTNGLMEFVEASTKTLAEKGLTISFAESASAGYLAYVFSQTENSGKTLKGGLVCYDACLKEDILKIPRKLIQEFTPESPEVTREMALRLSKLIPSDLVVAITGLTRPGGSEAPGKPVGTMFYCIHYKGTLLERKKIFTGKPEEIINHTTEQIAKTIIHLLEDSTEYEK